jgi:hypothetical protein
MFGKKKAAPPTEAATTPPVVLPGGLMSLMGMSLELVSVNRDSVDPQSFDVPAGYKKVAAD